MKKQISILYFFEIVFLVLPMLIVRFYLGFLSLTANFLNPELNYVFHFFFIAIYMFLVITIASKTEKSLLKKNQLYEFDNTLYLTISTIILFAIIYIENAFKTVFRYTFFPYILILFLILIIGPVLTFYLPFKKNKGWVGLFFIFCYYVFVSLAMVGLFLTILDNGV